MSARDFNWYSSNTGGPDLRYFPVTASETFQVGEPVALAAAGTLSEATTDPTGGNLAGIAAHRSTDVDGTDFGVGKPIAVYGIGKEQVFRTAVLNSDGVGGTPVTPTLANIGDAVGMALTGGVWSLDSGTANVPCEIVGVLDANGRSMSDPNLSVGTGSIILFRFL